MDTYLHTHAMANTDDTWGRGLPTVGERTWGAGLEDGWQLRPGGKTGFWGSVQVTDESHGWPVGCGMIE